MSTSRATWPRPSRLSSRAPHRPAAPLADEEVSLRAWRDADVTQLVAACRDPEIPRWTHVPAPYGPADAYAYLAGVDRVELSFAIVQTGDEARILGSVGLRDTGEHRADLGYWIAPWARRRGVAVRAVRLVCAWALGEGGFARVQILAATGNLPSQRVAERAGFTREALLRSHLETKAGRSDAVVFGLLAEDVASTT